MAKSSGSFKIGEYVMKSGELVTNGDFSQGTTGWTVSGSGSISASGGILTYTLTRAGSNVNGRVYQDIVGVFGHKYTMTIRAKGSGAVFLNDGSNFINYSGFISLTSEYITYTKTIIPITSGIIRIFIYSEIVGVDGTVTIEIDNISITEVPPLKSFVKNQKYLECTTAGAISFPSYQVFGVWEVSVLKGNTLNDVAFCFISSKNSITGNGYYFELSNLERLALNKSTRYDNYTPVSYVQNNIWYRIRVERTVLGQFTLLVKGGNFVPTAGRNGWTLVSTTGGAGTNPVTDLTYTTSNYFVIDLGAGDRITNILMDDEIYQP
jgi:hypothetical protein